MREEIRFDVARIVDGNELVDFLRTHGFVAELVQENGHLEVDLFGPDQNRERFSAAARGAVATWLARHEPPLVPTRLGDDAYALTPPGE